MSSPASFPPPRLISDQLWALFEPLIPPPAAAVHGRTGRPRVFDRDVLEGIACVLAPGIGWARLPTELDYGAGWTCWRRMRQWAEAGVVDRGHQSCLGPARCAGPAGRVAGQPGLGQRAGDKGGALTGPNPTDRGKAASTYPLLVDAAGLPLNVLVLAAHRHDSLFVAPILNGMPAVKRGGRGHPRRRPGTLPGDKGDDLPRVRRSLRRRGITAWIARIGVDSSQRLGRYRGVVEPTLGWLLSYQRLALRYHRSTATSTTLARLAVILICAHRLPTD